MATKKIVETNGERSMQTKRMSDMKHGEVCYVSSDDTYVLCATSGMIEGKIFICLNTSDGLQVYENVSLRGLIVRELYPLESITIKFS